MKQGISAAAKRMVGRLTGTRLNPDKGELIDFACQQLNMPSFVDLGAVWNVDGGCTFYAMKRHRTENAVIVDSDLTPLVLEKQKGYSGLRIIEINFGNPSMPGQNQCEGVHSLSHIRRRTDWADPTSSRTPKSTEPGKAFNEDRDTPSYQISRDLDARLALV